LGVVRNGSAFKLGEYFYRINADWYGTPIFINPQ
jgi:hypothetical protein